LFAVRSQLLIDLDGNHRFDGRGESVTVDKPVTIAGTNYRVIEIARDGTSFKLVPAPASAEAQQAADRAQPSPIRQGRTRRASAIGQSVELTFTDVISGKPIDLQKDLKGRVVVLDFWATWCGPCVAEMPHMKQLYAQYKDKGVEFIGVSLDNPEDKGGLTALKKYAKENEIGWPQYHVQGKGGDHTFASGWGGRAEGDRHGTR
jgi:thiol-disulfide isomerase/thioredoxin